MLIDDAQAQDTAANGRTKAELSLTIEAVELLGSLADVSTA
jgi:hypothetical protein